MDTKELSYIDFLGDEAALKFLHLIIGSRSKKNGRWDRDCRFGIENVDRVYPNFFEHKFARKIAEIIIDYYNKKRTIPFYPEIKMELKTQFPSPSKHGIIIEYLNDIKFVDLSDTKYFKEISEKYLKFQRVKIAHGKIGKILDTNQYDKLDECEHYVREALNLNRSKKGTYRVGVGNHTALNEHSRNPIPTGLGDPFDKILNGGVARSEFALFVAALGAGKTTLATIIANHAFKKGYKVLQVFFEDTIKQIQTKQYACWTGLNSNDVTKNKKSTAKQSDRVIKKAKEAGGEWFLKRFDSGGATVDDLDHYLEELENEGIVPDIVLIDYLECFDVADSKKYSEDWKKEKEIARQLENLCSENNRNFACIAFTQGGKTSWNSSLVDVTDMGGNFKKAQIAHIIVTVARTNSDRKNNLATFAILKSRVGGAGEVFKDVHLDNGNLSIRMTEEHYAEIDEIVEE